MFPSHSCAKRNPVSPEDTASLAASHSCVLPLHLCHQAWDGADRFLAPQCSFLCTLLSPRERLSPWIACHQLYHPPSLIVTYSISSRVLSLHFMRNVTSALFHYPQYYCIPHYDQLQCTCGLFFEIHGTLNDLSFSLPKTLSSTLPNPLTPTVMF